MKDDDDRLREGLLGSNAFVGTVPMLAGDGTSRGRSSERIVAGSTANEPNAPDEIELVELDETMLSLKHRTIEKSPSLIGEGLLKRGRIAILYGVGGGSKSWITFRLALAVARGSEWCGLPTTTGRVGIVSFEMFDEDIQTRLLSIDPFDENGLESVLLLSRDKIPVLKLPAASERVLRWVKERKLDLLIVDPLADTLDGPETNETIGPILDELKRFTLESGAAVLLVHHTRKGDTSGRADDPLDALRGPSQLRDRVDLLLHIEKRPGDLRRLTCTKARGAKEPEPVWLDATGAVTEAPETAASQAQENITSVCQFMQENHGTAYTAEELVTSIGLQTSQGTALQPATVRRRYLAQLVEEGLVRELPRKGQKDKKRWKWATEESEEDADLSGQTRQEGFDVPSQQKKDAGE